MNKLILPLILILWSLATARADTPEVTEYVLDNGMKILVQEDHRSPVVVSQVWYRVGSSYEWSGITGASHVLEHMMFKGTEKLGPGRFSEIIAENGGRENAFTSRDYTAYFQRISSDRLDLCLELEADRMRNLRLDPTELAREIDVVKEERRLRTEDDPGSQTYEHFIATAFVSSPLRNPVIGWMEDLDALDLDDVSDWYQQWYAPNNAVLVVVGDVEPEQVLAMARKHFGPHPRSNLKPPKPRPEVRQLGSRRIRVELPAELPSLIMGYKVPGLKHAADPREAYALEVLSGLLSSGDGARLPRRLVRGQQIAASAGAGYDLYGRLPGLFTFSATPAAGIEVKALEQALQKEIEDIKNNLPDEDELARIKAGVVAANVYQRDSTFYQAMQLGILESNGLGWGRLSEYLPAIQAVTAEQVQAVARKYLVDDQLTLAELQPSVGESAAGGQKP